jgi:glycosyltransferase involved in cell wall biosynthesis
LKRQALVLEALSHTRQPVYVRFAGAADHPDYAAALRTLALKLNVHRRVEWMGHVTEDEKRSLYANALGVIFSPLDEDYGYVTLEAMLSSKPVITCADSGGPLEFVRAGETGLIVEPTPAGLAVAMDRLWEDPEQAQRLGTAGFILYQSLDISWPKVVQRLLS